MATLIRNGFNIFTDKEGNPIEEGYIFIGEAGLNPISNPQQAYWDSALTIPATNIRTDGGYPVYNGSPSRLYVEDNYSILVQNKQLQTVYVQLDAEGYEEVKTPLDIVGFDNTYVTVLSAATITIKAGSLADVNGTAVEVVTDINLTLDDADTDYYIRLTSTGALSLNTSSGTFDTDQNARYLGGDRILNWVVRRDGSATYLSRMIDNYNVVAVDQDVSHTKDLTIAGLNADTVDTGQGAFKIGQNLRTTDNVVFNMLGLPYISLNMYRPTENDVYDAIQAMFTSVGDKYAVLSSFSVETSVPGIGNTFQVGGFSMAERTDASTITFTGGGGYIRTASTTLPSNIATIQPTSSPAYAINGSADYFLNPVYHVDSFLDLLVLGVKLL